jgi:hypothetical protein
MVCRLQLLLSLASAVILRSESRGTHDHILLSQIRDSPSLQGQVPVYMSPRNRVARFTSTSHTNRTATLVFESASTPQSDLL